MSTTTTAACSAPVLASKRNGKRKLESNQHVQCLHQLISEVESISLDSPLTKVTALLEKCCLGSDPSVPHIHKFPLLILIDRLSIDTSGFPEDEVCDNLDEAQYDEDVSVREILCPKKLLPRLGSKTLAVLRTVAENPCGISLSGPPIDFSQIIIAMQEAGRRVRNYKDIVPYLTIACSSIHVVGGGEMTKEVPDYERWTAQVCRDLPAVAKLLDPTVLFLLTGPGVALPALNLAISR